MICKQCGTAHDGDRHLPGSGWIELVLWLAYLVPGLIYSIWRRGKSRLTCSACGSCDLVPLNSPIGRKLRAELFPDGVGPLSVHASANSTTTTARVIDGLTRGLLVGLSVVIAATGIAAVLAVTVLR